MDKDDKVLFIDDFLANGAAAMGAIRLVAQGGAKVVGIGIVIEKAFQPGRVKLQAAGYDPYALASVAWMDAGQIEFVQDEN